MTNTETAAAAAPASRQLQETEAVLAKAPTDITEVERGRIDEIKGTIDLMSATSVINFGTQSEKQVADFADTVLEQVMSRDMGPIHDRLSEIKLIASGLDVSSLKEDKGFFGRMFFNVKKEIAKFTDNFQTARGQIDSIAAQLEDQIQEVNLGLIMLDKLFDQNLNNFEDLTLHIVAGREVMEHYKTVVLPEQKQIAEAKKNEPDALIEAQRVRDLQAAMDRLDRKIMNLEKSRAIAHAAMPTIRQVQQTGITLVEELKSAIAHGIPAWKNTMLIHVEQLRQKKGLESLKSVTDFTNSQLKAMADQLQENTIQIHEQTKRGIADVDAIAYTISTLVQTLDKVDQLEKDAREARTQGRITLAKAEEELRAQQARVD